MNIKYIYTGIASIIVILFANEFLNSKYKPLMMIALFCFFLIITIKDWRGSRIKPKFNEGDRVRHKISRKKYVIAGIYPVRWFRNKIYYNCTEGKYNKNNDDYYREIYESELEEKDER